MAVSDWSTTAADNTNTLGIALGEGAMAVASINNALREIMAQVKTKTVSQDALIGSGATGAQPLDTQLTALAATSPVSDQFLYFTSTTTAAAATVTSFIRTLMDDTDAATACATLGAIRVTAMTLGNPGYVKLQVASGQYLMVAWGTCSIAANTTTAISYAASFPNASFAVVNAGRQATGAQDNDPFVSACSTSGCTVYSASDTTNSGFYIAVGY